MVSKLGEKNFSSPFYFRRMSDLGSLALHEMYTLLFFFFNLHMILLHEASIFFSMKSYVTS